MLCRLAHGSNPYVEAEAHSIAELLELSAQQSSIDLYLHHGGDSIAPDILLEAEKSCFKVFENQKLS